MSRKLLAVLVSTAMAFGSVTTSAWSAGEPAKQATTAVAAKNQSPLPSDRYAEIGKNPEAERNAGVPWHWGAPGAVVPW